MTFSRTSICSLHIPADALELSEHLLGPRSIHPGVIGLDNNLRHLPVLDHQRISLAPLAAEDSRAVKGKVKRASEGRGGIGEEADLERQVLSDI